jgi:hypothetical protein
LSIIHYIGNERVSISDILNMTSFKGLDIEEIEQAVEYASSATASGRRGSAPRPPLEIEGLTHKQRDLVIDIVRTRKKASEKFTLGEKMFFTSGGLRWATPEAAAEHCASRLVSDQVMDITCGQGGQALFFVKAGKRVTAVDIDPLNCIITHLNAKALGIKDMEIVCGDSLSKEVVKLATEGCCIFIDPARPPGSKERKMEEILPDPTEVHGLYSESVFGICFEVPPYMDIEKVPFDMEAEYVSFQGRLNRLNLYTGKLKEAERSVVILPGDQRISGSPRSYDVSASPPSKGEYISEIDHALIRSGLAGKLLDGIQGRIYELDKRRTLLVARSSFKTPFTGPVMKVLGTAQEKDLKTDLRSMGAGSVTLRFHVEPSEYWKVRGELERELKGSLKVDLYRSEQYIIAAKEWDDE